MNLHDDIAALGLHAAINRIGEELRPLFTQREEIAKQIDTLCARGMRLVMLACAEREGADRFAFDANYEYDDEGGYFWSASYFAFKDEVLIDDEWTLGDELHTWDAESVTQIAFESPDRMEGSITVERLRELLQIDLA